GVPEASVLSTCNRTEIYTVGAEPEALRKLVCKFTGISPQVLATHLYSKSGREAVLHLFEVASGIDSAVLGENEILAQIKEAWSIAKEAGSVGTHLEFLLQKTLVASKKVRTQTTIAKGVTSVGSLAVRETVHTAKCLTDKTVVLVGA